MKIIQPEVELWRQGKDVYGHIARCARICYRSNGDKLSDSKLVLNLKKMKHLSVFRHETVYAKLPLKLSPWLFGSYRACPYIESVVSGGDLYVVTNGQFLRECETNSPLLYEMLTARAVEPEEFESREETWNLMRYTFKVTTQISTSRELNRTSPNSISEQSTRYVEEDGVICKPHWLDDRYVGEYDENANHTNYLAAKYLKSCKDSFDAYKLLREQGMERQDARGVLPLDTATVCAYTYSVPEWKHIIGLRYYGVTGKPHENCRIIAGMIKKELEELGYDIPKEN